MLLLPEGTAAAYLSIAGEEGDGGGLTELDAVVAGDSGGNGGSELRT